jgi:hypothetical protein
MKLELPDSSVTLSDPAKQVDLVASAVLVVCAMAGIGAKEGDGTDTVGVDTDGADTVGDGADTVGDGTETVGDGADNVGDGADTVSVGAVGSPRAADGDADLVSDGSVRVGTAATGFIVGDPASDPLIRTVLAKGVDVLEPHSLEVKVSVVASPVQSLDGCFVELSK